MTRRKKNKQTKQCNFICDSIDLIFLGESFLYKLIAKISTTKIGRGIYMSGTAMKGNAKSVKPKV